MVRVGVGIALGACIAVVVACGGAQKTSGGSPGGMRGGMDPRSEIGALRGNDACKPGAPPHSTMRRRIAS